MNEFICETNKPYFVKKLALGQGKLPCRVLFPLDVWRYHQQFCILMNQPKLKVFGIIIL
jgi:hypothetical protein